MTKPANSEASKLPRPPQSRKQPHSTTRAAKFAYIKLKINVKCPDKAVKAAGENISNKDKSQRIKHGTIERPKINHVRMQNMRDYVRQNETKGVQVEDN